MTKTMSILDVIQNGKLPPKSNKLSDTVNAMKWRQKYLGADIYPISLNDGRILNFKQVENGELNGFGTGATLWPAAHVLSKYIESKYINQLSNLRVCDIGSGTGCVGLVSAALGAQEVILTDLECIFFLLEKNKATLCNDYSSINPDHIKLAVYDWDSEPDHLNPPFDLIFVSDCILPKLYPIEPLVKAVSKIMGPLSIALFSYEHRPYPYYDPRYEFERLATQYGLMKTVIPYSEHDSIYRCQDIELWEVRRIPTTPTTTISTSISNTSQALTSTDQSSNDCHSYSSSSSSSSSSSLCNALWSSTSRYQLPVFKVLSWGSIPIVTVQYTYSTNDHHYPSLQQPQQQQQQQPLLLSIAIAQNISGGEIGCMIWPSGVILSRLLLTRRLTNIFKRKSTCGESPPLALDLGAGCGLTTIALLLAGYEVISTDKHSVLQLLQQNIESFLAYYLESISHRKDTTTTTPTTDMNLPPVHIIDFDWTKLTYVHVNVSNKNECSLDDTRNENTNISDIYQLLGVPSNRNIDLVVCSDCVYSTAAIPSLLNVIQQLKEKHRGTQLFIANELRSAFDEFLHTIHSQSPFRSRKPVDTNSSINLKEFILEPEEREIYRGPWIGENDPSRPVQVYYSCDS